MNSHYLKFSGNLLLGVLVGLCASLSLSHGQESNGKVAGGVHIFSVVPGIGPLSGGNSVSIQGRFGLIETVAQAATIYAVYFGEARADFERLQVNNELYAVANAGELYVVVPDQGFSGPTVVDVRVEDAVNPGNFDRIGSGYTYTDRPLLSATGFEPTRGPMRGGTPVTLFGNFGFIESIAQAARTYAVYFGDKKAAYDLREVRVDEQTLNAVANAGELYVISPPQNFTRSTNVNIRVEDVNHVTHVTTIFPRFRYEIVPVVVTEIEPPVVPTAGGVPVTLFGNFGLLETVEAAAAAYTVYFGDVVADFDVQDVDVEGVSQAVAAAGRLYVVAPPLNFDQPTRVHVLVVETSNASNSDGISILYADPHVPEHDPDHIPDHDPHRRGELVEGWNQLLELAGVRLSFDCLGSGISTSADMQCFEDALRAGVDPALQTAFEANRLQAARDLGPTVLSLAPAAPAAIAFFATLSAGDDGLTPDECLDSFVQGLADALGGPGVCFGQSGPACSGLGHGHHSACDSSCYDHSGSTWAQAVLEACFGFGAGGGEVPPADPGLPELCPSLDNAIAQLPLLLEALQLDGEDIDEDGLPERYALALVEYVACQEEGSALWGATANAFEVNYIHLYNQEGGSTFDIREALAVLLSVSAQSQQFILGRFAELGVVLEGDFPVITCDGDGMCAPAQKAGRSLLEVFEVFPADGATLSEPYSGAGDLDGDGVTNAEEFENVRSRGGSVDDFQIVATHFELDGTEPDADHNALCEGNLIQNPGFESEVHGEGWSTTGTICTFAGYCDEGIPRSGRQWLHFKGSEPAETLSAEQEVTIPMEMIATLQVHVRGAGLVEGNGLRVVLTEPSGTGPVLDEFFDASGFTGYVPITVDLSPVADGVTRTLGLFPVLEIGASLQIDDVCLGVSEVEIVDGEGEGQGEGDGEGEGVGEGSQTAEGEGENEGEGDGEGGAGCAAVLSGSSADAPENAVSALFLFMVTVGILCRAGRKGRRPA